MQLRLGLCSGHHQPREGDLVSVIARIRFAILAYFRSRDDSTPLNPRKDGS